MTPEVQQRAPLNQFAEVDHTCASFSTWWNIATREVSQLRELPGLAQPPYSHSIVAGGLPEMS